jgi:hypothetical protein
MVQKAAISSAEELDRAGDCVVRASTGESAPSAQDIKTPAI